MHATGERNFAGGANLLPCFILFCCVMVRQTKTTLCSPLTVWHMKLRRYGRGASWHSWAPSEGFDRRLYSQVKTNGTER